MDHNIFYSPEAYGLTLVGHADIGGAWEFDKFVIWSDGTNLFWATDSGCSCPTPFEWMDRTNLTTGSYNDLVSAISNWGSTQWDGPSIVDIRMSLISAVNDWRFTAKEI